MTTPWRRLLPSLHQVAITLVWMRGNLNSCLRTSRLRQHNCLCRQGWWGLLGEAGWGMNPFILDQLSIHVFDPKKGLKRTPFYTFLVAGAHPEGPWHLELGSTGWSFFHQEPGTKTIILAWTFKNVLKPNLKSSYLFFDWKILLSKW